LASVFPRGENEIYEIYWIAGQDKKSVEPVPQMKRGSTECIIIDVILFLQLTYEVFI